MSQKVSPLSGPPSAITPSNEPSKSNVSQVELIAVAPSTAVMPKKIGKRGWGKLKKVMADKDSALHKQVKQQVIVQRLRSQEGKSCFINPKWKSMRRWDIVMIIFLIFTATFTPYEVAFLETSEVDGLFIFNRIVDLAFFIDIIINLFLGVNHPETGRAVSDLWTIRTIYFKGWFFVDLLSVLPFDTVSYIMSNYVPAVAEELASLKVLRIIRLFRLVKLLKILQASRILNRWQSRIGVSFAMISMIKYAIGTCILAHWLACAFRFLTSFLMPPPWESWMVAYGVQDDAPTSLYITSLYWSITTLTTVGYGDVTPQSAEERIFCIISMVLGGMFYAYVIGGVCGIVASMDEVGTAYRQLMDMLNMYMDEVNLKFVDRMELREYFMYCRSLQRDRSYKHVLEQMSPGLQAKFAQHCHGQWIETVYFFRCDALDEKDEKSRMAFAYQIALALEPAAYPPSEEIIKSGELTTRMYIINRGLCARLGCVLGRGRFFGEDMILNCAVRSYCVMSMTFVGVYVLERDALRSILATGLFPKRNKLVRKAAIRLALMREFVKVANQAKHPLKSAADKLKEMKKYGNVGWAPLILPKDPDRGDHETVRAHNTKDNHHHEIGLKNKAIRRKNGRVQKQSNAWQKQNGAQWQSRCAQPDDRSLQSKPDDYDESDSDDEVRWKQRHDALIEAIAQRMDASLKPLRDELSRTAARVCMTGFKVKALDNKNRKLHSEVHDLKAQLGLPSLLARDSTAVLELH